MTFWAKLDGNLLRLSRLEDIRYTHQKMVFRYQKKRVYGLADQFFFGLSEDLRKSAVDHPVLEISNFLLAIANRFNKGYTLRRSTK